MTNDVIDREPEKVKVEKELGFFRVWFSILSFLLCAVAFAIGFPALADAGHKIGLGNLALGLPFAIDLGMVTLLLWSMWNRGSLKRWWPPLIPAGALLALSSYLQYIHAVTVIPEDLPAFARGGLLVLAAALPLLLALSAGVFEAVTFAPLIDRARRHTTLLMEQQVADDELWRVESESRQARASLEADAMRERMKIETEAQLELMAAEAEAAAREIRGNIRRPAPRKRATTTTAKPKTEPSKTKTSPSTVSPDSREQSNPSEEKSETTETKPEPLPVAPETTVTESSTAESTLVDKTPETLKKSPEPKPKPTAKPVSESESPLEPPADDKNLVAAVKAVRSGEMSQRKAGEVYNISRGRLRRYF